MTIKIEPMLETHWDAVCAIYLEGIATGFSTFETSVPDWPAWDQNHLPHSRLVARGHDGAIVGWAALSAVSKRPVYAGVAEVSVYVARAARGHGVGGALLGALVVASEQAGIWTLQGSVFKENQASLALHKAAGFRVVGIRERISKLGGTWRDTVLVERRSKSVGV